MITFIFSTDLHGNKYKFEALFKYAQKNRINLIHIGADILPKGSNILSEQKRFINGYLKEFYSKCSANRITVIGMFGNDDIYTRKKYFKEYGTLLDEQPYIQDEYEFTGYGFVPDYPFGLKTACKLDYDGFIREPQLGPPMDVNEKGIVPIIDIQSYFRAKGTIEQDLKYLKGGNRSIVAIHSPPEGYDLDVCMDGRRVGSKSVTEWILREKPLLVLCGHIHESYFKTNIWKAQIGSTLVIQPGQLNDRTSAVLIKINGASVNAHLLSL